MGSRAQVKIVNGNDPALYLYSHWQADALPELVKSALARKLRWDDPEYLARIIFDEMTKGRQGEETGYGISTVQNVDILFLVVVDVGRQTVHIDRSVWAGGKIEPLETFEKYIT